ncbi:MAG: hypothetical protein J5666_03705 [Bacilli bacterium]|nr:hypothetical protein [Bacilli bacterium]
MIEYNDNELLYLLSENEEFAFEMLMEKYQPMIVNRLKRYHVKPEYWDDYYQECIILLYKCATNYREDITKTFNKYYDRLLQYHIQNLLRKDRQSFYRVVLMSTEEIDNLSVQRLEEKSVLEAMSYKKVGLDNKFVQMIASGSTIKEIAETNKMNYFQAYNIVKKFRKQRILNELMKRPLSKLESSVYELSKMGYKPKEIASLLSLEIAIVYNSLKRIRKKEKNGSFKKEK